MRSNAVALREYDFRRPTFPLNARVVLPGKLLMDAAKSEIYDHHSEYAESEITADHAKTQLEQYRADAKVVTGKSNARRFAAGHRFSLDEHPQAAFDGEYVITKVTHRGLIPEINGLRTRTARTYENDFECVPATVPFRPRRPKHDLQQVVETAVVVGDGADDITTDVYGRIKVRFPWDCEDKNSCWIRVAQTWAGATFGFQFIPRVGMEVLVTFIGGDEDRPVVIGCLYNQTHPTPFPLPTSKTRSGIRTRSSPKGDGSNELIFEDAAEQEAIILKAERDLREQVNNDHMLRIGHEQHVHIAGGQHETIAKERYDNVGGDEVRLVGGRQSCRVNGNQEQTVLGRRSDHVDGASMTYVNGWSCVNKAAENVIVDGQSTKRVGTNDKPASMATMVYGTSHLDATKTITLNAEEGLKLVCGDTVLTLSKDELKIESKSIVMKASGSVTMKGDGPSITLDKKAQVMANEVNVYSKAGALHMDDQQIKIAAPNVSMSCDPDEPVRPKDVPASAPTRKFKWKMIDADLTAYKNKTYTLVTQGFKVKGTTDGDGVIEQDIPADAVSVQLTLWPESFPQGKTRRYIVAVGDSAGERYGVRGTAPPEEPGLLSGRRG